ncbi:serine/threonine-protein kinase [Rhizobium leguminosarum]
MTGLVSALQIGAKLGNGHFGEVHLGEDPVHGPVAVKIYRALPGEDPTKWNIRKSALLAEGVNLRKAKHRHVVQVHHIVGSQTDDAVHLVMELCEQGSLQSRYEAGPLPTRDVHTIATDICHGLGALHDREMLHRDIKPGNLLMDKDGVTKLGDFGLVTDDIILGYASAAGYIDHLAPEVFETGQTSSRSDFWALGMTLYRLLHGEAWYRASPAPRYLVRDLGYADRLTWLPHISSRWRRLVRALLNDDPHARLATHGKVLDALAGMAGDLCWVYETDGVSSKWHRNTKDRLIEVTLEPSGKKWVWAVVSYPIAKGVKRTIGTSGRAVNRITAEKSLRAFFEDCL